MLNNLIKGALRKSMGLDLGNKPRNVDPIKKGGFMNPDNSPQSHLAPYPYSYATLQYPLDIQQRSDLGHYMLFYINVINETGKPGQRGSDNARFAAQDIDMYDVGWSTQGSVSVQSRDLGHNMDKIVRPSYSSTGANGQSNVASMHFPATMMKKGEEKRIEKRALRTGESRNGSLSRKIMGRSKTKRTTDAIVLYMPPSIVSNYNSAYKESEFGSALGQLANAGAAFDDAGGTKQAKDAWIASGASDFVHRNFDWGKGSGGQGEKGFMATVNSLADMMNTGNKNILPAMSQMFEGLGIKAVGALAKGLGIGDASAAYHKMTNQHMNQFLETMFSGIGFRKFSWMWKFAPKSPAEAEEADAIIRLFKFHMLPELPMNDYGRYFKTPSEFDIHYMFRGEENTWLNKISTCVCINCDVNYAPNSYQTMRPIKGRPGAPMSEIELKLDFMETELITKEKILEGF